MRNKPNPRIIGLFVIGAIALFMTVLVTLGGGFLTREPPPAVIYFDGSVNGLYVGAPVNFRGVRVGSVSRVDLVIDSREHRTQAQNRAAARERLLSLLERAAEKPRRRKPTRPDAASREARLAAKKERSAVKASRRPSRRGDE